MVVRIGNLQLLHVHLAQDQVLDCKDILCLFSIDCREEKRLEWLTHDDLRVLADRKHERSDCLCECHLTFERCVGLTCHREVGKVYAHLIVSAAHRIKVGIELVGIEWSDWSHQSSHGLKTCIECLISRELVGCHLSSPETLAVEAHIPVREIVAHEGLNQSSSYSWLVCVVVLVNLADECVER